MSFLLEIYNHEGVYEEILSCYWYSIYLSSMPSISSVFDFFITLIWDSVAKSTIAKEALTHTKSIDQSTWTHSSCTTLITIPSAIPINRKIVYNWDLLPLKPSSWSCTWIKPKSAESHRPIIIEAVNSPKVWFIKKIMKKLAIEMKMPPVVRIRIFRVGFPGKNENKIKKTVIDIQKMEVQMIPVSLSPIFFMII